jgi:dTDP-4-amino-4,6-dideoxygalactose transaminase
LTDWKIPLADLDLGDEEIEAVCAVLRSRWLTMGPRTVEFEAAFAKRHRAPHAVALSSGTAALHLAYAALGVSRGDEVILPSLTFVATANPLLTLGATPVFADIVGLDEPTLDPDHVARLISAKTRAIVAVHYAGYPARVRELAELAKEHDIPLIEDCAHAPGVEVAGRPLGSWGAAGCFSFFSNKNITTGEGGMLVTSDPTLAARVRLLRSHGMTSGTWERHQERPRDYDVLEPGWNYRIDEMRSAIGLVQLGKLDRLNAQRRRVTRSYRAALAGQDRVTVAFSSYQGDSAAHILPALVQAPEQRTPLGTALAAAGVQTSHHFPPVHLFSVYRRQFGSGAGMLPKTESFAAREITLPLHAGISDADVELVGRVITSALQDAAR